MESEFCEGLDRASDNSQEGDLKEKNEPTVIACHLDTLLYLVCTQYLILRWPSSHT